MTDDGQPGCQPGRPAGLAGTLREAEEDAIHRAMEAAGGNKSQAARILGIDRNTLHARLKRMESA